MGFFSVQVTLVNGICFYVVDKGGIGLTKFVNLVEFINFTNRAIVKLLS